MVVGANANAKISQKFWRQALELAPDALRVVNNELFLKFTSASQ